MRYKALGRSGLAVSELCLGCATFGGSKGFWQKVGQQDERMVEHLVGTALDAGVNFIDTANAYSDGESESLLGHALRKLGRPRDQVVVATKVRGRMGPGPNQVGLSRAHILHAVEESLRRLQLSHIDLYTIHGLDPLTPMEETLHALHDVVQQGKVRYLAFSNLPAWAAMKALAVQDARGWHRFINAQLYYSIAGRDIERELVPLAEDQGLGVTPWSPLAAGLLTGKYDVERNRGPADARRSHIDFPPVDRRRARACIEAMRVVADAHGASIATVALAWMLRKPHVTSIIIGARTMEHLRENLAATGLELSAEEMARLDEVSALPSEYPGWMLAYLAKEPRL